MPDNTRETSEGPFATARPRRCKSTLVISIPTGQTSAQAPQRVEAKGREAWNPGPSS